MEEIIDRSAQMVQCPHCKKEFALTEALSRQLENKIRMQVNADLEKCKF